MTLVIHKLLDNHQFYSLKCIAIYGTDCTLIEPIYCLIVHSIHLSDTFPIAGLCPHLGWYLTHCWVMYSFGLKSLPTAGLCPLGNIFCDPLQGWDPRRLILFILAHCRVMSFFRQTFCPPYFLIILKIDIVQEDARETQWSVKPACWS